MEDIFKNNEKQEPIDYTELIKGYSSKWIIISDDNTNVIAYGDTPEDIMAHRNKGIIMKVPDNDKFPAL